MFVRRGSSRWSAIGGGVGVERQNEGEERRSDEGGKE